MLSKLSKYYSRNRDSIILLPQLNAEENNRETFTPKPLKCAARNCAILGGAKMLNIPGIPRVLVIDSAANISMFHLVAGFIETGIDIYAVSHGVSWDAYDDGIISVTPFSSTTDAYLADRDSAFDVVFLDACGTLPLLLGDICGINIGDSSNYVSAFESLPQEGGIFGITWCNSRQICTEDVLAAMKKKGTLSRRTIDVIYGYTDEQGTVHEGYGVFVQGESGDETNDEVPLYEWTVGLMAFVAKLEGFGLDLFYSAFEKGIMRTVLFRAYPLSEKKPFTPTLTGPACVKDFYSQFSSDDLKAHDGVLFSKYLVPVFKEAVTDLNKANYTLIADLWKQTATLAGVDMRPYAQNAKSKKDKGAKKGAKKQKKRTIVGDDPEEDEDEDVENVKKPRTRSATTKAIVPNSKESGKAWTEVIAAVEVPVSVPEKVVVTKAYMDTELEKVERVFIKAFMETVMEKVEKMENVVEKVVEEVVEEKEKSFFDEKHKIKMAAFLARLAAERQRKKEKQAEKKIYLCGNCKQPGHNSRSCNAATALSPVVTKALSEAPMAPMDVDYTINNSSVVHRGGVACAAFLRMRKLGQTMAFSSAGATTSDLHCSLCYKSKDQRKNLKRERSEESSSEESSSEESSSDSSE